MRTRSIAVGFIVLASLLMAQTPVSVAQEDEPPPITVTDVGVGYIDGAVIGNQLRIRFDAATGINQPNRAEFLWGWPPPQGPGPSLDETNVDYQRLSFYFEQVFSEHWSWFVEAPVLFSQAEVNSDADGFSDLQAGVKWNLVRQWDRLLTLQLRTYVPTGKAADGLGSGHVTLEPGLLYFSQPAADWTLEGELRAWIPVDATPLRHGNILRYGLGASYHWGDLGCLQVRPVVEFVGWTVLDGQSRFATGPGTFLVEDADGQTIVNGKYGLRLGTGQGRDLYIGYGHALTSNRWYRDIVRLEWRIDY
jgi:hypothetical protein